MQLKFIFKAFLYSTFITGCVWAAGCSKNEHPITEARFTNLDFKTFSTDALQLKVLVNETTLTDSLMAPDGAKTIAVQYFDPKHRIRLVDAFSDRVWLDTVINYKPGFVNALTFYQPFADANFTWIGPPVNEQLPADGFAKISIRYTHTVLPDLLKVVVENNTSGTAYSATDSFELQKNEFSKYFLGYNTTSRKVRLKLYSTDGKRKLMAWAEEGNFSSAKSADYNIYVFRKQGLNSSDSIRILGEKLY